MSVNIDIFSSPIYLLISLSESWFFPTEISIARYNSSYILSPLCCIFHFLKIGKRILIAFAVVLCYFILLQKMCSTEDEK